MNFIWGKILETGVYGNKKTYKSLICRFFIAYKSCVQCLIRRKFGSPDNQWGYLQAHLYFSRQPKISRPTDEIMR